MQCESFPRWKRTSSLFSLPSKQTHSHWNRGEAFSCLRWGCSIFFNAKKQQQHIHTLGWCCNLIYCIFLVFFYCNCIKPANISLLAFYILLVDLNKPLTRIVKLWVQNVKSCTVWSWLDLCQWNHLQLNCYEYLSKCPCILHKPYSQALHKVFYCLIFFFPEGPPPLPVREKDSTIPEVHSGRAVIGKWVFQVWMCLMAQLRTTIFKAQIF